MILLSSTEERVRERIDYMTMTQYNLIQCDLSLYYTYDITAFIINS
jgi:hypothetical protein